MRMPKSFVLSTGGLLIGLAVCFASNGVQAQREDSLLEAQIAALQTRDVTLLEPFGFAKPNVKLAAELTKIAVDELNHQIQIGRIPGTDVSRESALLTSEFIQRGAERAIEEDPLQARQQKAKDNLRRFIDAMVKVSIPEHGKIGETTFAAAKSVCPLWPFC